MEMTEIFKPVMVQAILMILIGFWLVWARVGSVLRGKVNMKDVQTSGWRGWIKNAGDNYNNQYEMPVLFFVTCMVLFLTEGVTPLALGLAWFFVITRLAHAIVHLSFNHVGIRFLCFFSGALSLAVLVVLTTKGVF